MLGIDPTKACAFVAARCDRRRKRSALTRFTVSDWESSLCKYLAVIRRTILNCDWSNIRIFLNVDAYSIVWQEGIESGQLTTESGIASSICCISDAIRTDLLFVFV